MIKIYHNSRCSKSREALNYLKEKGVEFKVIEYLKDLLTKNELTLLLQKLKKKPEEIIRKQESAYKAEYKNRTFSDEEWIEIMVCNPKLIQRPIVENDKEAIIGNPVENINHLLK